MQECAGERALVGSGGRRQLLLPPGRIPWAKVITHSTRPAHRCTRAPWSATRPAASWPSPWLPQRPRSRRDRQLQGAARPMCGLVPAGALLRPPSNSVVARCRALAPRRCCRVVWLRCSTKRWDAWERRRPMPPMKTCPGASSSLYGSLLRRGRRREPAIDCQHCKRAAQLHSERPPNNPPACTASLTDLRDRGT